MKKIWSVGVVLGIMLICSVAFAMDMDHSKMKKEDTGQKNKDVVIVKQDGYTFKFNFIDLMERMKASGMKMDMGGMTHHLMVFVKDEKSGKKVTDAKVMYKIFAPSGKTSKAMPMLMGSGFGADISLSEKGEHGIACMVKIGDKKHLVKIKRTIK